MCGTLALVCLYAFAVCRDFTFTLALYNVVVVVVVVVVVIVTVVASSTTLLLEGGMKINRC
jgi:hypothetical protein